MTESVVQVDENIKELLKDFSHKTEYLLAVVVAMVEGTMKGQLYDKAIHQYIEAANDVRFSYENLLDQVPMAKEKLH